MQERITFNDGWKTDRFPLKPTNGKADQFLWHETLHGFGYRVRASGMRAWYCQGRAKGRTQRHCLGPFEKLKPAQARKLAERYFAEVLLGGDPTAKRRKERQEQSHTMLSVAKLYLDAKRPELRKRTLMESTRYLTSTGYLGKLHHHGVGAITRKDVAACVTHIANQRGKVSAARARACLSAMYSWAMGEGIVESNPVIGSNRPKENAPRDHVLKPEEIAAVWKHCGNDDFGCVVKLLLLTGCRRSEIGGLSRSEVNDIKLTIPGSRTKNHKTLVIPLSTLAKEIIDSVPHRDDRALLFGDRNESGFCTWASKAALDAKLGKKVQQWTLHDLRRTFASGLGDLGVQPHIIECLLGHRSGFRAGVAGTYNWSTYAREMRQAVELWADHIRSLVGGERKVLPLHRKAT
jgi:integrase